jgi:hypothetical protein
MEMKPGIGDLTALNSQTIVDKLVISTQAATDTAPMSGPVEVGDVAQSKSCTRRFSFTRRREVLGSAGTTNAKRGDELSKFNFEPAGKRLDAIHFHGDLESVRRAAV